MMHNLNLLATKITKDNSIQTYFTIKLLFDKPLVNDGFKAYAYFRWIDDQFDREIINENLRKEFIWRQKMIIEKTFDSISVENLIPEELIIVDLINTDRNRNSLLASFILNMLRIIEFDVNRKNRLISQAEFDWYTDTLSKSVTDCIAHFVGHGIKYPNTPEKYDAGKATHIMHMLRDYPEDLDNGIINIPKEIIEKYNFQPSDFNNPNMISWIQTRVDVAKSLFNSSQNYIDQLPSLRSKIAVNWYCTRFKWLISEYENNNFHLGQKMSYRRNFVGYLRILFSFFDTLIKYYLK